MRKLYFGTNLKMYKNVKDTVSYLQALDYAVSDLDRSELEIFVIPSYTSLEKASSCIDRARITLGAQNMCWEEQGQFTGEISPLMLDELGIHFVMAGHSERRHIFRETDIEENRKIQCALKHGFHALLCVGETLEEKNYRISDEILQMQLKIGFHDISSEEASHLMVAYEPVWAIGESGQPASPEYARARHRHIRQCLAHLFGSAGESIPLLYGGSVNHANAKELISDPNIDGLFVGRSAWQADSFNTLIRTALAARKAINTGD